jgi:hypothetical protein
MTGDVFYREVKPTRSPRGSIVPPGCEVKEIDGRQILHIPADVAKIDTPIVFPGFIVIIEAPSLTIEGPTIVDAALAAEGLEASGTAITTSKEVEVIGLLQARSVRARIVRGERIEAQEIDADVSVCATGTIVARSVTVRDGAIRASQLIAGAVSGEKAAADSIDWSDGMTRGLVPEWLGDG